MQKSHWIVLLIGFLAFSCQNKSETKKATSNDSMKKTKKEDIGLFLNYTDHHSSARPDEAVVTHLNWIANINFEQKTIQATAIYTIDVKKATVDSIFLDAKNIKISSITRDNFNGDLTFSLKRKGEFVGSELAIPVNSKTNQITINYETTEGADALQFLDPVQTADKSSPFLFTQSQAILGRTWLPSQDSPGIRFTYEATVKVPKGLMALMSAGNPTEKNQNGIYHFKMDQAVPSYLVALAVGNIEYKSLGSETGIYAEPSVIESAAYEFEDMQNMVDTAESLYGEYSWGRYDLIVLPPSFPYGGMENPRLTFATPTIIAGDKSLTSLIAHELAHSWSGNLVTNATWEDLWLNEGFTVYFENRIMEEIFGKDFANMLALLSHRDLLEEIERLNEEGRSADTRLRVDLEGRNPDEGLTGIPYEKGFFLLKLIEETVGRDKWDTFLKQYFETFQFEVMTSSAFLFYLDQMLLNQNPDWNKTIQIKKWVYEEGLPENCPQLVSTKFEEVDNQMKQWKNGSKASTLETKEWMTPQWLHFISQLDEKLSESQMQDLDKSFGFTASGNSEIKAAWFEKTIPNNYNDFGTAVEDFLIEVGRRKFLTPIYKAILKSDNGVKKANEIYNKARPNYHAVSRETLDALLSKK